MKPIIAPSFLSADFSNLQRDAAMLNGSQAEWFHLDIMDGVFVPNLSFGFPVVKAIRNLTTKVLDVHLMIIEPDKYVEEFQKAGADVLTVHYEACTHLHRTVQKIKSLGMKAGVALNPHTPVSVLEDIVNDVDMVLLMSVNPGFGGQKFIENTYSKIVKLKALLAEKQTSALIEIDGGVDLLNFDKLVETGATVLVAGNSVFKSENPVETIAKMLGAGS